MRDVSAASAAPVNRWSKVLKQRLLTAAVLIPLFVWAVLGLPTPYFAALLHLFTGAAEAALTSRIGFQGLVERARVEIGPQGIGEIQLGIGEVPQQKIADALFTAGANEEIGLGQAVQFKLALEQLR